MKKEWSRSLICGFITGFALYLIAVAFAIYNESTVEISSTIFIALSFISAIITITALVYGKPALSVMLFRGIILKASFWFSFVLDSVIGITRYMNKQFFSVSPGDYAWGLILLMFIICNSFVCIITITIAAIMKLIAKWKSKS